MKQGLMMKWYWLVPYCAVTGFGSSVLTTSLISGLLLAGLFGFVYGVVAGITGW